MEIVWQVLILSLNLSLTIALILKLEAYLRCLWTMTECFIVNGTRLKSIEQLTQCNAIFQKKRKVC